jgi:hypothetical protein
MMGRRPTIAQAARRAIRQHGPRTLAELVDAIVDEGGTRAKDPLHAVESSLRHDRRFVRGRDDRVHSLIDELEGAIFTRRRTSLERRYNMLVVEDDLALVMRLIDPFGRRGSPLHVGWLDDLLHTRSIGPDLLYSGRTESVLRQIAPETAELLADHIAETSYLEVPSDEAVVEFLRRGRHQYISTWSLRPATGDRPQLAAVAVRDGEPVIETVDRSSAYGPHVFDAVSTIATLAASLAPPDARSGFGSATLLAHLIETVVIEAPTTFRTPLPPVRELVWLAGLELNDGWIWFPEEAEAA